MGRRNCVFSAIALVACMLSLMVIPPFRVPSMLDSVQAQDTSSLPVATVEPITRLVPGEIRQLLETHQRLRPISIEDLQATVDSLEVPDELVETLLTSLGQSSDFWLNAAANESWVMNGDEDAKTNPVSLNLRVLKEPLNQALYLTFDMRASSEATVDTQADKLLSLGTFLFPYTNDENADLVTIGVVPLAANSDLIPVPVQTTSGRGALMLKVTHDEDGKILDVTGLMQGEDGVPTEAPVFVGEVRTQGANLNLRNRAGQVMQIPGLPNGTTISVLDTVQIDGVSYFKIYIPEGEAYVNSDFVEIKTGQNLFTLPVFEVAHEELALEVLKLAGYFDLTDTDRAILSERNFEETRRLVIREELAPNGNSYVFRGQDLEFNEINIEMVAQYYDSGALNNIGKGNCPRDANGRMNLINQIVEVTTGGPLEGSNILVNGIICLGLQGGL